MADFDHLQDTLRQQLVALFHEHAVPSAGGASGADPDILTFEPIGVPLPASGFRLTDAAGTLSPEIANETLTALADAVPSISNGEYRRTLRSIAAAYEQTLFALALPGQTTPAIDAIERTRASAHALFEQAKRATLRTGVQFCPIAPIPVRWYDPMADVWTKFSSMAAVGGTASTSTKMLSVAAPARSAPAPALTAWNFKLLPQQDRQLLAKELVTAKSAARPAATAVPPPTVVKAKVIAANPNTLVQTAARKGLLTQLKVREHAGAANVPEPKPATTKTSALDIRFEACVVTLTRPWMYWPWMDTRGWYMPGYRSGQLCLDDQPLHRIPVSAILVRNLTLAARGASSDELKDAVAFGPFQFVDQKVAVSANGATFDVSVSCPTVQLIAWVTQPLSGLPPKTDPSVPDT